MNGVERPIFIVGVDHSGTTILYRMLARHPELAWFSQYSLRGGDFPGRMWVPCHGWVNRTGRALFKFDWRKGETSVLPEPREGAGIWRRLIPRDEGFLYESDCDEALAERVRSAFRAELDAWRLERILIKIPYITRAVRVLNRIFPDALFIHIVRDGKAVALSNYKRFMRRPLMPEESLRVSADRWVDTLEYIEGIEPRLGPRLVGIRYEELCEDVHGLLRHLLEFCGLDPARLDVGPLPDKLKSTNEKWLANCPEKDRRLVNRLLTPTLVRWGYEPFPAGDGVVDDAVASSDDAPPRGAWQTSTTQLSHARNG